MEYVARHIINGEPYEMEALKRELPAIEAAEKSTRCRPVALWSSAIIRLRMFERAIPAKVEEGRKTLSRKLVIGALRRSLSCSPAEPFLWLVLFWEENADKGFSPQNSKLLQMSYLVGPNEGWVALKRNPLTLAWHEKLSPDLVARGISEFSSLVNSGFYRQAVETLRGPGWKLRFALMASLASRPIRNREAFAHLVYDHGLKVEVPGVPPPDSRHRP